MTEDKRLLYLLSTYHSYDSDADHSEDDNEEHWA